MFRVMTSWRLLAAGLAVSVLTLIALAVSVERMQTERTLQRVVDDAELISELLLEVNLRPEDSTAHALSAQAQQRVDAGVDLLQVEGRLVGLQLLDRDGHVLYSDSSTPENFTADEQELLSEVLAGRPQVEFEHDDNRDVPTATVLIQPENQDNLVSGLVAEVLLPQDEVTEALSAGSRRLYGTAGGLLAVLVAVSLVTRRRMLRREHEALHDALTGLGNRTLLAEAGRSLLPAGKGRSTSTTPVALLVLDLDGFKTVNDTLVLQP